MNRLPVTLSCLLMAVAAAAAEPAPGQAAMPAFTWGISVGFAANSTYVTNAVIDGHQIEDYRQDTQLGNFSSVLFRLNSKRLFVQTGCGLSMNKSTFYIDRNSWNPESESVNEMGLSYSMKSLTVPVMAGFHIISNTPYCMSVFTGPSLRLPFSSSYSTEFTGIQQNCLEEDLHDIICGWTVGLGVQIGRSVFDFEYEIGMNCISDGIHSRDLSTPDPGITLDRRMGILSFSFGIMF